MDIRHVRYFVAVAGHLSFSEAARKLNMSQPPLSQRIRELELRLGCQLFKRNSGQIELSAAGEAFLPKANHLLDRYDAALETIINASQRHQEPVRILSCAPLGSQAALSLLELLDELGVGPLAIEHASQDECLRSVRSGKADLALGPIPDQQETDFKSVVLCRATAAVALPIRHRLCALPKVSLGDLVSETWLLPPASEATVMHSAFRLACRQIGMDPHVATQRDLSADHCLAMVGMVRGVALMDSTMVGASIAGVKVLPLHRPQINIPHRVLLSPQAPSELFTAFAAMQRLLRTSQMLPI